MADLENREKQLKERLAVLEGRLHRIEAHLEQPADKDWEENATAAEMDEVLEELGHAGNAEVQAIYAALERLKLGTYGNCARCGEQISKERLDVLPHTPLCKTCAREVSQKR
jgi:RNA polymerase-binding transcription factor DksA